MSNLQTYRVLVRTTELHSIDIAARSEEMAILRAEKLWFGGMQSRFDKVMAEEPPVFDVDQPATCRLADIANEDRAGWALKALRAFAAETGSELGREALHDLLCDLGHYADQKGMNFQAEIERAAEVWAEEKAGSAAGTVQS